MTLNGGAGGVADYFAAGDRTMTVQLPVGSIGTLYAKVGDLFAWLCIAGLAVASGSRQSVRNTIGASHRRTVRG